MSLFIIFSFYKIKSRKWNYEELFNYLLKNEEYEKEEKWRKGLYKIKIVSFGFSSKIIYNLIFLLK